MEIIKKFWVWLNGHKTLIGTFGLLILQQDFAQDWNVGIVNILTWVFGSIMGGGALHKVVKKFKKAEKKNGK